MSTSEQHTFSSVLSVNPYKETYFKGVSSFLSEEKAPEYSKEQLVISYLNTKEFINAQIEISKNIPDEDLYDALSNKAYDELALDQAVEYKIQYVESFSSLDEENRHFHVFIVDPLDITNTFAPVVESVKYIDVIIPVPLLIKSLYVKEIVNNTGVHGYIYFQENDAFLTIYSEKEFIYTKSIKYSFVDMHERFCELYGERIDYDEFLKFFTQTNLKESESEYKTYIIKLYKELFANINDILTYTKRAFEIDKIDHIYIGSQIQTVTQLDEMIEAELNIQSSQFNFDYGFENNDTYVDQLHALMHLYSNLSQEDRYKCNFTEYKRPPRFIQRDSGRLITVIAASLALAFAYPITYWVLTYAQSLQKDLLQQKYNELHNTRVTREATIKNRLADKEKSLQLLTKEETEYNEKKNTLIKIHEVKVDYPMKAKLLATFTKEMSKFYVKATKTYYHEKDSKQILTIDLAAKTDRRITRLVEHLTKVYEGKYTFELEEILLNTDSKMYLSELKVKLP
ncbi:hypothetical protein [Sulfurimonas marina]|uniref:Uncharacterized protein n=1 Tax=Sulfurimonas marina TaxID=2590551 RepID=A0A7M1AU41_9BACT|nr:hypothetical protein [Sulfurimonas marina]QOP40920.1 hypothetical protein FJR03_03860 [Sulfurimonas marina]